MSNTDTGPPAHPSPVSTMASKPGPIPADTGAVTDTSAATVPSINSPSPSLAMDCTSDQSLFTIVQIHTAKCARCDKRNMDTMRRCPGCTYQICQPCVNKLNGRPIDHGNTKSSLPGLGLKATTPVRRRVLGARPLGGGGVSYPGDDGNGDGGFDSAINSRAGADGRGDGDGDDDGGSRRARAQEPAFPAPAGAELQQRVMPELGKRSRAGGKAKGKFDYPDTSEDEGEFVASSASPTRAPAKNRKIAANKVKEGRARNSSASGAGGEGLPSPSPKKQTDRVPANTTASIAHTMPDQQQSGTPQRDFTPTSGPDPLAEIDAIMASGPESTESEGDDQDYKDQDEETYVPNKSKGKVPVKRKINPVKPPAAPMQARYHAGDDSIQALLEAAGVDTPGNRYHEHLLSRHMPQLQNPLIMVPPHLRHDAKPRPTVQELQKNIQDKLLKAHVAHQVPGAGRFHGKTDARTLREFAQAKADAICEKIDLDEDQRATLRANVTESVRKYAAHFDRQLNQTMGTAIGTFRLDMVMHEMADEQKTAFEEAIKEVGRQTLEYFAEEDSLVDLSPRAAKRAKSTAPMDPKITQGDDGDPNMPRKGMFHVFAVDSPPRSQDGGAAGK